MPIQQELYSEAKGETEEQKKDPIHKLIRPFQIYINMRDGKPYEMDQIDSYNQYTDALGFVSYLFSEAFGALVGFVRKTREKPKPSMTESIETERIVRDLTMPMAQYYQAVAAHA